MRFQLLTGILIIILATCSGQPTSTNSGVQGQVFIGPLCPVVQVGQECPDQPYQATLTVNSPGGEKIVQIQTDEQGQFSIPLVPGEYVLHPESQNGLPFAVEQTFTVSENAFTQLTITYDSGIR
jgi:hypothetical protein